MKRDNPFQGLGCRLVLSLLLGIGAVRGQPADEPAADQPARPEREEKSGPTGETNDAAVEIRVGDEEGFHFRVHGRDGSDIVRFGSNVTVREGQEVDQVVVIFGDATIDGKVRDAVVVVGGKAKVNGTIGGELVVPLGSVELGPNAHVEGDVTAIGGGITADPGARIDGNPVEVSWSVLEEKFPPVVGVKNWVMQGLILGRPLPHQFGWWWYLALACAAVYLLTALVFGRPITASVGALEAQPVGSFFMGVLMFILFVPLLLLLLATGVGVIVVPFVFCGAIVAFLFGKVTVYQFVGQQLGKQTGVSPLQQPLVALIIGIAILYAIYAIPFLGFLVWFIVAPLGLGAVMLAAFRAFRSEGSKTSNPTPVMMATAAANAGTVGVTAAQPPLVSAFQSPNVPAGDLTLLPRAGFWIRFVATFVDLLLVVAVLSVLHVLPAFLLVWVIYHIGMWTWKGTTIGGVVFGIKVVRKDGRPLDFAVALVRSLASFLSFLALFLGFFWAGWTRERQSWHDMIAGTVMVRVPKGVPLL
jgi:RDD family protein